MNVEPIVLLFPIVALAVMLFFVGIAIGHSKTAVRLRVEENRKREIEHDIIQKRAQLMKAREKITENIDDLIFKANVHREIENITREL